jgi:hypothetical protein
MENQNTQKVSILCAIAYDRNVVIPDTAPEIGGFTPIFEWDEDEDVLTTERPIKWVCYEFACEGMRAMKEHAVIEVELPTYMDLDYYVKNCAKIERMYYLGLPRDTEQRVIDALLRMDDATIYITGRALRAKPNDFWGSIKRQLLDWIDDAKRTFCTPFSNKQVAAILRYSDLQRMQSRYNELTKYAPISYNTYKRIA